MRPIDADELKEKIRQKNKSLVDAMIDGWISPGELALVASRCIDEMPTIKIESVKHGKWKVVCFGERVCSCCFHPDNSINKLPHDYCPNCGAKMDLEDENDKT